MSFLIGVLVAVVAQFVIAFVVDPIKELRRAIGRVQFALVYHSRVITSPGTVNEPFMEKAEAELRQAAARLASARALLTLSRPLEACHLILPVNDIATAGEKLMGLSNAVFKGDGAQNATTRGEIRTLLSLPDVY